MTKETIIHHKIDQEHYIADAFIAWCFDARFHGLLAKFIENQGWSHDKIDLVKMAGGAKVFATPEVAFETDHYHGQIEKSVKLHHTKRIILMAHANCGAYGKQFESEGLEAEFYSAELHRAKKILSDYMKGKNINIPIDTYYGDFYGLHLIT